MSAVTRLVVMKTCTFLVHATYVAIVVTKLIGPCRRARHSSPLHFFHAIQGNQKLGAHSIAPRLCPPLLPTVTTTTTTVVKKTMARGRLQRSARRSCTASSGMDFCRPPPSIGWALTALRRGERRAPDDDDDNDDDDEGGDEEEVDGR